jgi:hypothetical protein
MGNIGRRRRRIEVLPTEPVTVPEPAPAFVAWCSLCRSGRDPTRPVNEIQTRDTSPATSGLARCAVVSTRLTRTARSAEASGMATLLSNRRARAHVLDQRIGRSGGFPPD